MLRDKAFRIAGNSKCDKYQYGLASIIFKCFDKKSRNTISHAGTRIISKDRELANELHKPITRKFQMHNTYSSGQYNI